METGLDVAKWLLADASVGAVPGECFLIDGREMTVRITLKHSHQEIVQAFDSIIAATSKISSPAAVASMTSAAKFYGNNNSRDGTDITK